MTSFLNAAFFINRSMGRSGDFPLEIFDCCAAISMDRPTESNNANDEKVVDNTKPSNSSFCKKPSPDAS